MLDLEPIKARLAAATPAERFYVYTAPAYRIKDGLTGNVIVNKASGGLVIVPDTADASYAAIGRATEAVRQIVDDGWVLGAVEVVQVSEREINGAGWIRKTDVAADVAALLAEVTRLRAALTEVAAFDHAEGDAYERLCDAVSVAQQALEG